MGLNHRPADYELREKPRPFPPANHVHHKADKNEEDQQTSYWFQAITSIRSPLKQRQHERTINKYRQAGCHTELPMFRPEMASLSGHHHAKAGKIEGELAKNGKDREVPRTPTLRQVLQMLRDKDGVARKGVSFS